MTHLFQPKNWVVERKNKPLEKIARKMLNESNIPNYFWADAVSIAFYVMNQLLISPILKRTLKVEKNKKGEFELFSQELKYFFPTTHTE